MGPVTVSFPNSHAPSAVCNHRTAQVFCFLNEGGLCQIASICVSSWTTMAEQPQQVEDAELQTSQTPKEDMMAYVIALEAALLPCLPARELQAIDRSPHPSHQIDVERHARDFMEAAKKLQLYFIGLQRYDKPTKTETLRKEIATMDEELKVKNDLIKKQERLIQGWRKELKDQLDKHYNELERV